MNRRAVRVVATLAIVTAFSLFSLKWLPVPFAWIGLAWGVIAFVLALLPVEWARMPLITLGAVAIALGMAEVWFAYTSPGDTERHTSISMSRTDAVLGWATLGSRVIRAKANVDDRAMYDVIYTIDAAGHRIVAPDRGDAVEGCVFFFVDSFAFGEGVNDADTLPYQFGTLTQGRFRVVNYAAPGYGAEHMLANIERGELARSAPCAPTHIVYLALPHHILRAAGKPAYSARGPHYRLRADGTVEYFGTGIGNRPSWWQRKWQEHSAKSYVLRVLLRLPRQTSAADANLYFAIVRQAFRKFAVRWPNAQRHIISWDIDDYFANGTEQFHRGLATADARVTTINEIVPGYTKDSLPYSINVLERHPNPHMYGLIARHLAADLLTESTAPVGRRVSRSP